MKPLSARTLDARTLDARALPVLVVALLLSASCVDRSAASAGLDRESLERRQGQFLAALAARDADATAERFAEDALLHMAGMPPVAGREAIRRFYGNVFGFLEETGAAPASLEVASAGDLAYSVGATRNAFRGPDGPVEYEGKFVLVWRKVDDDWLIAVYAISSDAPEGGR